MPRLQDKNFTGERGDNAMSEERGTLAPTEPHPSSQSAMSYIKGKFYDNKLNNYQEAFSSCAIEGNRLGEICAETMRRIMHGKPVSDRYLLGLAWAIRDMEDKK